MRIARSKFVNLAFLIIAATTLAAGCGKKDDSVAQAEKKDAAKGVAAPGIAETKAIAEEGFIYGLPIVMNYAVMYEYAVDRNSGQFKAPFNEIKNEPRVYTYKDTAIVTPNSDTPYSFLWMDLRTEPMVLSVPAVEKSRYYAVQLEDGNTFNFGYIGSRTTGNEAGDYMVAGPIERGDACRHQEGVPFHHAIRTGGIPQPSFQSGRHTQCGQSRPATAQPLSAYLKQPAPPAAPAEAISRRSTRRS
jgi:hypothetical protein